MAHDFEDLYDLDDLGDDELQALVRAELADYGTIDSDSILVRVEDGVVSLSGRIGTEEERRIAEHVLTDVLGITRYENNLVVDPIRRDEEPEAIDDHLAHASSRGEDMFGGEDDTPEEPAAEHLDEDLDDRLYGTRDMQSAIENGTAWIPPDTPTPEGLAGLEPDADSAGEEH
jgi:hypothetical protein